VRVGSWQLAVGSGPPPTRLAASVHRQPPTANRQLPPGIRSWRDGRVLTAALRQYELVVVGCSMGGMHALGLILAALPEDFGLPIVVVQHRYKTSNEGLPDYYGRHSSLRVVDASDKQWLRPGEVYLAPADYHLLVDRAGGRGELNLSADDAVAYSRPSIDVLFVSAAETYGAGVIAVILTGANSDGTRGAARVKQAGGFVLAQDPETAEAPAMPRSAIEAVRVDRILPLDRIGPFLVELSRNSHDR
jgi:two-component system, chemotaxis family, protein-glutamate methylesterase/glutaminase